MIEEVTGVIEIKIRKRGGHPNVRKSKVADNGEDNSDEGEEFKTEQEFLDIVRADQKSRVRKNGFVVKQVNSAGEYLTSSSTTSKSIESSMKNQFSSQKNDGYGNIAHENILEQYISDKLGLESDRNEKEEKVSENDEDKLYRLPDDLKFASKLNGSEIEEQNLVLAPNAGIEEVALPIGFKMKNIAETESARRAIDDRKSQKRGSLLYTSAQSIFTLPTHHELLKISSSLGTSSAIPSRFQLQGHSNSNVHQNRENRDGNQGNTSSNSNSNAKGEGGEPPLQSNTNANANPVRQQQRGVPMSSDDRVMENFKKKQRSFRH